MGESPKNMQKAKQNKDQERLKELKALFAETQALPQAQEITDEVIAAEIDAYRAEEKAKNMPQPANPKL